MTAILYSGSGDARLSETLHAELRLILADRLSLWGHPAIVYAGNAARTGSTTIKVPFVGQDDMSAVAEGTAVATTALSLDSVTVTIAGQHLRRDISDLNVLVDTVGLDVPLLVQEMVPAAARRWMAMLCGVLDGHTATAGGAGPMTLDRHLEARYALQMASVPGPYLGIYAPEQVAELIDDVRGETGAIGLRQDSRDIFSSQGAGVVLDYLGDQIVQSSYVETDTGARKGALFGRGAHCYADGTPRPIAAGSQVIPAGQQVVVELQRDAAGRLTQIVGSYYVGVSMLEDERGVTVISDAA